MNLYQKAVFYSLYLILMWLYYDGQPVPSLKVEIYKHLTMMMNEINEWEDSRFPGAKV